MQKAQLARILFCALIPWQILIAVGSILLFMLSIFIRTLWPCPKINSFFNDCAIAATVSGYLSFLEGWGSILLIALSLSAAMYLYLRLRDRAQIILVSFFLALSLFTGWMKYLSSIFFSPVF